jgi:hypothetical protein
MATVLNSPYYVAGPLAMQRGAVRDGGKVFADLLRVVVVVLELYPFRLGGKS